MGLLDFLKDIADSLVKSDPNAVIGPSFTFPISATGYSRTKDVAKLRDLLARVVADPMLQPIKDAQGRIIETHCNQAAMQEAAAYDCHDLDGKNADGQNGVMRANASGRWTNVDGHNATQHALRGGLAFASATSWMMGEAHGHIAAISPEPMQMSGSLGRLVPMISNVGRKDYDAKESQEFPVKVHGAAFEPDYFALDWNAT